LLHGYHPDSDEWKDFIDYLISYSCFVGFKLLQLYGLKTNYISNGFENLLKKKIKEIVDTLQSLPNDMLEKAAKVIRRHLNFGKPCLKMGHPDWVRNYPHAHGSLQIPWCNYCVYCKEETPTYIELAKVTGMLGEERWRGKK